MAYRGNAGVDMVAGHLMRAPVIALALAGALGSCSTPDEVPPRDTPPSSLVGTWTSG